jgi:hypothetical protein
LLIFIPRFGRKSLPFQFFKTYNPVWQGPSRQSTPYAVQCDVAKHRSRRSTTKRRSARKRAKREGSRWKTVEDCFLNKLLINPEELGSDVHTVVLIVFELLFSRQQHARFCQLIINFFLLRSSFLLHFMTNQFFHCSPN